MSLVESSEIQRGYSELLDDVPFCAERSEYMQSESQLRSLRGRERD